MRVITRTSIQVDLSAGGGYSLRVACNAVGEVGPVWDEVYSNMRWCELVDVILLELEGRRPGWALDEGMAWRQPPLFDAD